MRIIGGEARGRKLIAPAGLHTRPTSDRAREAVFNILGARVLGAAALDLFAGSGALALEALSRGAGRAVLVDSDRAAALAIERNIRAVKAENRATLIRSDWRAAIERLRGERFALVFLDPPYHMEEVYAQAAQALLEAKCIDSDSVLVMEHARGLSPKPPHPFEIYDRRRYADTEIGFARVLAEK